MGEAVREKSTCCTWPNVNVGLWVGHIKIRKMCQTWKLNYLGWEERRKNSALAKLRTYPYCVALNDRSLLCRSTLMNHGNTSTIQTIRNKSTDMRI